MHFCIQLKTFKKLGLCSVLHPVPRGGNYKDCNARNYTDIPGQAVTHGLNPWLAPGNLWRHYLWSHHELIAPKHGRSGEFCTDIRFGLRARAAGATAAAAGAEGIWEPPGTSCARP